MFKVSLVNMPFAALFLPSIGLTQLKYMLDSTFGDKVSVQISYINHEFGEYLGVEPYTIITNGIDHQTSGLGDWFFRKVAFPNHPDNTEEYFRRFYPRPDPMTTLYKQFIQQKRPGIESFLDKLITKYELDKADLVGLTSMFSQNVASFAMARKIKDRNPNAIVVIGGANCESPMGQEIVKNVPYVDFTFSGPGLKNFPQFVQHCMDGEMEKCHALKGVFSKENQRVSIPANGAGGLVVLGSNPEVPQHYTGPSTHGEELDINVHIELNYDSFLDSLESFFTRSQVQPTLMFETSRGCWWGEKAHCTFCGLNGESMGYRAMDADKALNLINSVLAYTPRCTGYNCVDNIMPKEYLRDVFPHINPPSSVNIFYEVKADLSEEDLQTLAKARVTVIQPGVESLATSTLKLMKKGTSAFQNIMLLKNCSLYGIRPEWNLLIGFPGEEEDVYKKYVQDLPLLVHLTPPSGVFPVRFDRYSPYFTKAKQYGLDLHPVDYYGLIYPFSKESLANLAYYFSDHNLSARYFTEMVKWIDKVREKFNLWVTRWNGKDQSEPAKLFIKEKGKTTTIFDSRSGSVVHHTLSEAASELLDFLSKPKRLHDVASGLSHIAHFDPEREMNGLKERGLIFEENDRFLSLVLPKQPSAPLH
jgi:ribosomal peptide maturation radical SAM protein 1